VESRQLPADPERGGRIVAADRLVPGDHQVVEPLAIRLLEQGDRLDRILDGWSLHHSPSRPAPSLAGAYQFAPSKRRSLATCRHPFGPPPTAATPRPRSVQLGIDHGLACLGSSWALMLLMFAEGFANLWWMIALTALMVYETAGRHGRRAASAAGIVLLLAGLTALAGPLSRGG
jgi:hypothetical protein